ncbi:MAG: hypothetical protein ACI857_001332 [Arenicella sp.]|jgi:hypothetical protein
MKKLLLSLFIGLGSMSFAQEVEAADRIPNFNPEDIYRRVSQDRTVTCGVDTVLYHSAKATGTSGLTINNVTSASAMAQYFDAPQDLTISGVDFIAVKVDDVGGTSINVDVEVYSAGADSLPTGAALASAIVAVDTNFYGGNLILLTKSATFSVPVTVTGAYVIVITNDDANGINMYSNDYLAFDGGQEWLASALIGGTWLRAYNVSVGGSPYDADMFMYPYVEYDLTADFSITPNCQDGGNVTANHMSTSVASNRMYSFEAFAGTEGNQYTWDWGDASATETGLAPTHTYAAGAFNVTLTDTVFGWTSNCVESITKSTCDQPAAIVEESNDLQIFPNPASDVLNIKSATGIAKLNVYDLSGKLIYTEVSNSNIIQIGLSDFESGIYVINVSLTDGTIVNQRLEVVK